MEKIEKILEQIPISIEKLRPDVNYVCELQNGRDRIELIDDNWEHFSETFRQKCAGESKIKRSETTQEAIQSVLRLVTSTVWKKTLFAVGDILRRKLQGNCRRSRILWPFQGHSIDT
jgi:hypothetical protein